MKKDRVKFKDLSTPLKIIVGWVVAKVAIYSLCFLVAVVWLIVEAVI